MKNILIAGGSGLIGSKLKQVLLEKGHSVSILSRNPKSSSDFFWNPEKGEIDENALADVEVLINLCGAGIADKRWTKKRKQELHDSRVGTNAFLYTQVDKMPKLNQLICSSGINCYGFANDDKEHTEKDDFGTDYLSQLVKEWEASTAVFNTQCKVAHVRTAMVLDSNGGALKKLVPIVKMGIGSPIGSGLQQMPWIHSEDLANFFAHLITLELSGDFNALAGSISNKEFMQTMAKSLNKPFWFPNVPSFLLKLLFGEMSIMLLKGLKASNQKIKDTGFAFQFTEIESAFNDILKKR